MKLIDYFDIENLHVKVYHYNLNKNGYSLVGWFPNVGVVLRYKEVYDSLFDYIEKGYAVRIGYLQSSDYYFIVKRIKDIGLNEEIICKYKEMAFIHSSECCTSERLKISLQLLIGY